MRVIKFEKADCAPCKDVDKFLAHNGINVDERINPFDEPEMARKYKIMKVPTVLVIDSTNTVAFRSVGFKPLELITIKNI